mgnify:CR=1 FL=1
MRRKINLSLCLLPLLGACGGAGGQAPVKSVSAQPAPARAVPATKPPPRPHRAGARPG